MNEIIKQRVGMLPTEVKKIKIFISNEINISVNIPERDQNVINLIKSKIEKYIYRQDYDALMKIKRTVLNKDLFRNDYDMNTLDITDNKKKIDLIKLGMEKVLKVSSIVDSNESRIDKIVNEYVSFLILQDCGSESNKNIVND
jgi:hypothetical protein